MEAQDPFVLISFLLCQTLNLREQLSRRRSGLEEPGKDGEGQVRMENWPCPSSWFFAMSVTSTHLDSVKIFSLLGMILTDTRMSELPHILTEL